eukprot:1156622-Pelagomonas_calceolata.AAC.4
MGKLHHTVPHTLMFWKWITPYSVRRQNGGLHVKRKAKAMPQSVRGRVHQGNVTSTITCLDAVQWFLATLYRPANLSLRHNSSCTCTCAYNVMQANPACTLCRIASKAHGLSGLPHGLCRIAGLGSWPIA